MRRLWSRIPPSHGALTPSPPREGHCTESSERGIKPQSERNREFFLTSRKRKRRKAFPSLTLPARGTPGPLSISVWPQKDAKDGLCTKTPTGNRRIMTYVEFQ